MNSLTPVLHQTGNIRQIASMNLLKIACLFTMSLSKVVFALSDEKEIRLWSGQAPGERQGEIVRRRPSHLNQGQVMF